MRQKNKKSKRSQITIFVIIAIIIVAIVLIFLYPQIRKAFVAPNPSEMIPKSCIESAVKAALNTTLMHGGTASPELYIRYNNESIGYACYTSEWYKTCVMQSPLLKQTIQSEIEAGIQQKISSCIQGMQDELTRRGYTIKISGTKKAAVEIAPKKIIVSPELSMTISQEGGVAQTFSNSRFQTEFSSNAYDMIMIASSIQNYEARFGDSITESYMNFYPNIRIEKKRQDDGTKIYIITDRNTNEKLQFATRSLAFPPGIAFTNPLA